MSTKKDKNQKRGDKKSAKTTSVQSIFARANAHLLHLKKDKIPVGGLEAYRLKYLGSKGLLKELFAYMGSLPTHKKKAYGQLMNSLLSEATHRLMVEQNRRIGESMKYESSVVIAFGENKMHLPIMEAYKVKHEIKP